MNHSLDNVIKMLKSNKNKPEQIQNKLEIHPGLKIRHTLKGHDESIFRIALSPDGRTLASLSADKKVWLWDIDNGKLIKTIQGINACAICAAWSPDGRTLALGGNSENKTIYLLNPDNDEMLQKLEGHTDAILNISWSPDGRLLASISEDKIIHLWNADTGQLIRTLKGHTKKVLCVNWSPDSHIICSGSIDHTVRLWDANTAKEIQILEHPNPVASVVWSPNGHSIASGSYDKTVRIWNPETGQQTNILEGHTEPVICVFFFDDDRLVASLSEYGTAVIWRTDTWTEIAHIKIGDVGLLSNIVFHSTPPVIAIPDEEQRVINIWDMDINILLNITPSTPVIHYINAKAILIGESGVGKSGLGIRMAENRFRDTTSTHGARLWQIPVPEGIVCDERFPNVQAELTLWDIAGEPEYRLIHQLFLDDTDAALLLFDSSDPNDPFRVGISYWAKVLKKQAPNAVKLLVSARCDVSFVTVDRQQIFNTLAQYGMDQYFETSAKNDEGVESLLQYLFQSIPWDKLPRITTPLLFQIIREFFLERKKKGDAFISMDVIQHEVEQRYSELKADQTEIDTVITLLQARGLVYRLEPRADMTLVLMNPKLINQYASSIIQAARNDPSGIGVVAERYVLIGNISFSGFERLPQDQEKVVLEAITELFIQHDLCFREMGFLVFPSLINISQPDPLEETPHTEVAYKFSGSIENIYASLVVRLSYTHYFRREYLWKYAVEFSSGGEHLGFSIHQIDEGMGELDIYFYPGVNEFDRITFIRFVTDHLRAKGIDIEEHIRLYCKCGKEVKNREAIEIRVKNGKLDIPCQFCGTPIIIPKSIEERYQKDLSLNEKQHNLVKTVEKRKNRELEEFKVVLQQYTRENDSHIHILHLSDIHLENSRQALKYRTQLQADLINELNIKRLGYLVISGDIANHSTEEEYNAAFEMIDGLVKRFNLDSSRVVIVPGNHDINWDLSEEAYHFIPKRKLPEYMNEECCIPLGDAGALVRDDYLYQKRFDIFNTHFYKKLYGKDYPSDYAQQAIIIMHPDDRILFLALNSCWEIDHHFRQRVGINMEALAYALDRLQVEEYNNWLKIAVWHHPVTGMEMMNDDFVELLTVHGFRICMHGHIYEKIQDFHKYDHKHNIHIIGAGTFGTPTKEQMPGIPFQYNLLTYDPDELSITVSTRKKDKPDGAWSADARWGNKNNPDFRYSISLIQHELVEKQTEKELEVEHRIHILHLSDIHLKNSSQARKYRTQLETDLIKELNVNRLEYLIISGDIANHSTEKEYEAAFEMVDGLIKHFGLDAGRVVIVPGNHDLNWDISERAYSFIPKRNLPEIYDKEQYISAGDAGALVRDNLMYKKRFAHFNVHFYKKMYGREYPLDYDEQAIIFEHSDDRILFLALNSCWNIDHHFTQRAGINMEALSYALDQLQDEKYNNWLKIAVWHHPAIGPEMIDDEFMDLLTVRGFQICMHGHIHEAVEGFYKYDGKRGMHIIGAGTFGAPSKEQVADIPLQYNLLILDPASNIITVETRMKQKTDGAWFADARWGDKKNPKPNYSIFLEQYTHPAIQKIRETVAPILENKKNEYDVFLCHNYVDKPAIKRIGEQLKLRGILPWLDEWELRPGQSWQEALEMQIQNIKAVAVFIGSDGLAPWQDVESTTFLRDFIKLGRPVIPVILPDCKKRPKLPIFLQGMTWVDFRKQDPKPLEQLIWGISGDEGSAESFIGKFEGSSDIKMIRLAICDQSFRDYRKLAEAIIHHINITEASLTDIQGSENGTIWEVRLPPIGLKLRTQTAILFLRQKEEDSLFIDNLTKAVKRKNPAFLIVIDIMDIRSFPISIGIDVPRIWLRPEELIKMVSTPKDKISTWLGQFITSQVDHSILSGILPYNTRGNAYLFFGREDELRRLIGGGARGGIITGVSQSGKTSLLLELKERLHKLDHEVVCILYAKDFNELFDQTFKILKIEVPEERTPESWASALRTYSPTGRCPVILLDEVDDLIKLDEIDGFRIGKQMRSLQSEGLCKFYLAGFATLRKAITLEGKPFRNFAEEIILKGLSKTASSLLIGDPLRNMGFDITDDQTYRIYKGTAGVPVLIQGFCISLLTMLHQEANTSKIEMIDNSVIEKVEQSPDFLNMVFKYYEYAQWWESRSLMFITAILGIVRREDITQKFAEYGVTLTQERLEDLFEFFVNFGVLEEFEAGRYKILSHYLSEAIKVRNPEALLEAEFKEKKD
ncbi:MAG: TIR domain-containing protein [Desulfobacterales bacterium]|nr:TIR domain-containing protein [Desulfobacterales bacterium]